MEALISLKNVTKKLSGQRALDDISCDFFQGERVLLAGANGAGKSTLLKCILGIFRCESGEISKQKLKFGYASHLPLLYGNLSVLENLKFTCLLSKSLLKLDDLLESWNLTKIAHKPLRLLSKGQTSRVSLCRAFINQPDCLLLDEPTSALDENGVSLLMNQIALVKPKLVIFATHDFERTLPLATRIMLLESGRIESDSGANISCDINLIQKTVIRYRELNR